MPPTSPKPKSKRGRPRHERSLQSQTERRRAQVRHAQRTYRLRKESAIVSLQARIVLLETSLACIESLALHSYKVGLLLGKDGNTISCDGEDPGRRLLDTVTARLASMLDVALPGVDHQQRFDEIREGLLLNSPFQNVSPPNTQIDTVSTTDASPQLDGLLANNADALTPFLRQQGYFSPSAGAHVAAVLAAFANGDTNAISSEFLQNYSTSTEVTHFAELHGKSKGKGGEGEVVLLDGVDVPAGSLSSVSELNTAPQKYSVETHVLHDCPEMVQYPQSFVQMQYPQDLMFPIANEVSEQKVFPMTADRATHDPIQHEFHDARTYWYSAPTKPSPTDLLKSFKESCERPPTFDDLKVVSTLSAYSAEMGTHDKPQFFGEVSQVNPATSMASVPPVASVPSIPHVPQVALVTPASTALSSPEYSQYTLGKPNWDLYHSFSVPHALPDISLLETMPALPIANTISLPPETCLAPASYFSSTSGYSLMRLDDLHTTTKQYLDTCDAHGYFSASPFQHPLAPAYLSFAERLFRAALLRVLRVFAAKPGASQGVFQFCRGDAAAQRFFITRIVAGLKTGVSVKSSKWFGKVEDDNMYPGFWGPVRVEQEVEGKFGEEEEERLIAKLVEGVSFLGAVPRVRSAVVRKEIEKMEM